MSNTQPESSAEQAASRRRAAPRGRSWRRQLGGALASLVILLGAGAIYEAFSEAADARAYPPAGELVDVGGQRLHIRCMGEGRPTVVIEAGLGDWSTSWGAVQAEVAKTTQVCSYDRAGLGWSEPGPRPRDAIRAAGELHTLLRNADIPGPYVMVAHSYGGLPVQVFVHDYPAEVEGVVLIESMFPGQTTYATQSAMFDAAAVLARFGVARLVARPLGLTEDVPFAQAAYDALGARPQSLQTFADEIRGIPDSLAQAEAAGSFGEVPLIVLSRGLNPDPEWQAGQDQLAGLSSDSVHLVAEASDHGIQLRQPQAAVDAIVRMIGNLRR